MIRVRRNTQVITASRVSSMAAEAFRALNNGRLSALVGTAGLVEIRIGSDPIRATLQRALCVALM